MKILWFSHVPISEDINGTGSWINVLASHLIKIEGIELHIAFRDSSKVIENSRYNGAFIYRVPSIESSIVKNNVLKFIGLDTSRVNVKNYLRTVELVKPDIIQLFGFENDYNMILPHISVPAIIYIQSIYHAVRNKWYSGLSRLVIKKHSSFKSKLFRNTFNHQYERHLRKSENEKLYYKYCKYVIGRTDWDRRCSKSLSSEVTYFHCDEVLRTEFFENRWNREFENNRLNVISTIGSSIYKGFETIVETMILMGIYLDLDVTWRIIGLSNNDEVVKICKNKYKDKYPNNILLMNNIKAPEMVTQMLNSDLFVHPSHIENSSNAISEAMLLGMPIIATFAGGTSTLIRDNKSGLLVQDGDSLSLMGSILELYRSPERASSLGNYARKIALTRHSPDKIVDDLLGIYRFVLDN